MYPFLQYDDDMDVSYEGLLRLAARIGDAKPKNLPHDLKANLPRGTYKTCSEAQLEKRCAICLEKVQCNNKDPYFQDRSHRPSLPQYEHNDSVLGISECAHYFHASCFEVSSWYSLFFLWNFFLTPIFAPLLSFNQSIEVAGCRGQLSCLPV